MNFKKTPFASLLCLSATALLLSACSGDDGNNGAIGATGATGATGNDGQAGFNTLIRTTTTGLDRECDVGGIRLETGLDSNRNNTLDDSEVSQTSSLCSQAAAEQTPETISLNFLARYESGVFGESAAEIVTFDAATQTAFVVNAHQGQLDVLDMSNPAAPANAGVLTVSDIAAGAEVNSVARHQGLIALAIEAADKTAPGYVALYNADTLNRIAYVQVGALPDMLTFTPDGKTLLVANEGEPSDDYQTDPEGSISVIDVSDITNINQSKVRTAGFSAFNSQKTSLQTAGVRIFGPNATVAQDLEPEYIAVSADSKTAWASLQENNAVAVIDIETASVTSILPLGFKDHGIGGNGLDVSDSDDSINIQLWSGVKGMYQPDAIAAYTVGSQTLLVTANEGDSRAWGEDTPAYFGDSVVNGRCNNDNSKGFVEEWRVKHLVHKSGFDRRCGDDLPAHLRDLAAGALLNPAVFSYCGATAGDPGSCRDDDQLGRLNITWTLGYQTHADGTPVYYTAAGDPVASGNEDPLIHYLMYDELYAFGARSFAIRDADDMSLVYESGDSIEQFLASEDCMLGETRSIPCASWFNSNHEEGDAFDNRSDNKGPEPEGLTIGKIGSKHFLFLGLERTGGVMVYDISTPSEPQWQDYLNTRNIWDEADIEPNLSNTGDLGPEGLHFIPARHSPDNTPLLLVGNEVSGTTAVLQIRTKAASTTQPPLLAQ